MNITKIVLLAIFCLFIVILIKRVNGDYAIYISATVGIFIFLFALGILTPIFDYAKELCTTSGAEKLCTIMFKSAGICLLCSAGAEICRDFGEGSLASKIEFAGKCTLLAYCLPLIKTVFEYASKFVS